MKQILASYPNAREVIGVQEEPQNMGAWSYMVPHLTKLLDSKMDLRVIARPDRSSPAAGFWDLYMAEQELILAEASGLPLKQPGGKHVR